MKSIRKSLSMLLCLVMLLSLFPTSVFAEPEPEGYTVTFDANGGYIETEEQTEKQVIVPVGEAINFNPAVGNMDSRLAFSGWYLADDGSGDEIYPESFVPENDLTLFAVWEEVAAPEEPFSDGGEPADFTVTYDACGGAFPNGETIMTGTVDNSSYTVGYLGFDSWIEDPSCDGFTFDGWECEGMRYEIGNGMQLSGDTTFTATWLQNEPTSEPVSYTVTYDANGGAFPDGRTSVTATVTETYLAENGYYVGDLCDGGWITQPVRNGYLFSGWAESPVLTDDDFVYDDGSLNSDGCPSGMAIEGDTVLYACWEVDEDYVPEPTVAIDETNFPDDSFRAFVSENCDPDGDGYLSADERAAVTDINVSESGISSLLGVEYFGNLQSLDCYFNSLTELDLSANTALKTLRCDWNQLTALDVSANTALTYLNCDVNQLTALDVSANTALSSLGCGGNQLTALNLSANTALSSLSCGGNQLTALDLSANTALSYLACGDNQLTTLDLSANTALDYLFCRNNSLSSLDLSENTALASLNCGGNQLTALDLSANTALTSLNCDGNQLTALNLSANTALTTLYCNSNNLTVLDISACPGLVDLVQDANAVPAGYELNGNYLYFDEGVTLTTGVPEVEPLPYQVAFDSCGGIFNGTDDTIIYYYIEGGSSVGQDPHPECDGYTFLGWYDNAACEGSAIDTLDYVPTGDITFYAAWEANGPADDPIVEPTSYTVTYDANGGAFSDGRTSVTATVTETYLAENGYYVGDLCGDGWITQPVRNGYLFSGWAESQVLTDDDLVYDDGSLNSDGCPSGMAIEGDTVLYACWEVDEDYEPEPAVAIDETNFPDDRFRAYVGENFDADGDGYLSADECAAVTYIDVTGSGISSLLGVGYFGNLEVLYCSSNNLSSLDLSANTALMQMNCNGNQLTALDLSANTALNYLDCSENQLTALDVSANTALEQLYCSSNDLTSLDVSANTALNYLGCSENQLSSLDVSANTALESLACYYNALTALDLSANTALKQLYCYNCDLTTLDLSANTALTHLSCGENQLTSLDVSANTALTVLNCADNSLTALDLSANTALTYLICSGNSLRTLDLRACPALVDTVRYGTENSSEYAYNENYLQYEEGMALIIDDSAYTVTFDANGGNFWVENRVLYLLRVPVGEAIGNDPGANSADEHMAFEGWYLNADGSGEAVDVVSYIPDGDVTFYAKWIPAYYIVSFDANGGYFWDEDQLQYGIRISAGDAVSADPEAVNANEHLAFDGWYLDAEGSGEPVDVWSYIPDGDLTLYAKWGPANILTFVACGGYFYDNLDVVTKSVRAGCAAETVPGPLNDDDALAFDGWYLTPDYSGEPQDPWNAVFDGDTTFYVKWSPAYQVTFDANGGRFWNNETAYVTKAVVGQPINDYPTPSAANETLAFIGWYLTADCSGDAIDPWTYSSQTDLTLFAKWSPYLHVTLDGNGGYFEEPAQTEIELLVTPGDCVRASQPETEDEHQCFDGWYLTADCSGEEIDPWEYLPETDLTIYAGWASAYVMTFDANGGTFDDGAAIQTWKVRAGDAISADPAVNIEDETLAFAGWYLTADCSGEEIDPWEYCPETDLTLYAKWDAAYTVILDANGGYFDWDERQEQAEFKYAAGSSFYGNSFSIGNDEPFWFEGWYYDQDCTELACGREDDYVVESNVTLYAKWIPAFIVTFDANGGYIWDEEQLQLVYPILEGSAVEYDPGANIADERLAFTGWSLSADGSGETVDLWSYIPDGDVTLYAKWIVAYAVTFDANGGFLYGTEDVRVDTIHVSEGSNVGDVPYVRSEDGTQEGRGWFINDPVNGEFISNDDLYLYVPTEDVTFYARLVDVYFITLNANGGYFDWDERPTENVVSIQPGEQVGNDWFRDSLGHEDPELAFAGWYFDEDCTQPACMEGDGWYTPEGNITLYANWAPGYAVTFDGNGGLLYGSEDVRVETIRIPEGSNVGDVPIVRSEDGTQEGRGWYINDPVNGEFISIDDLYRYVPTEDVTFYARLVDVYFITLDANGGYFDWDDRPTENVVSIEPGEQVDNNWFRDPLRHEDPELAFAGWFFDEDCTQPACTEDGGWYTPEGNITLYAKWLPGYAVTFDGNGGFLYGTEDVRVFTIRVPEGGNVGDVPYVRSEDGTQEGRGWFINDPVNGEFISNDELYLYVPTEDVTFYARLVDVYFITLDANGGYFDWDDRPTENVVSIEPGEQVWKDWFRESLSHDDPELSFAGWYFDEDCTQPACTENGEHYTPEGNITLYAKWTSPTAVQLGENALTLESNDRQLMSFTPSESGYYVFRSSVFAGKIIGVWIDDQFISNRSYGDVHVVVELEAGVSYTVEVGSYDAWSGDLVFTVEKTDDVVVVTLDAGEWYFDGDPELKQKTLLCTSVDPIGFDPGVNVDEAGMFHFGWMLEDGTEINIIDYVPESDITLYPVVLPSWTLTLHGGEGGYFWDPETRTTDIVMRMDEGFYSMAYEMHNDDPTLGFEGWYYDEACTELAVGRGEDLLLNRDETLYAKWGEAWLVTFDAGEGYLEHDPSMKQWSTMVPKGFPVAAQPFAKIDDDSAMLFGWYLSTDFSGDPVDLWSYIPDGDVTFYADFEPYASLTLYAGEGGYFSYAENRNMARFYMPLNEEFFWDQFELDNTDPGLGFAGWYYDEDCTELALSIGESTFLTSDMTLYAKWVPAYTVVFDANGGFIREEDRTQYVFRSPIGDMIGYDPGAGNTDEHLAFDGWYLTEDCSGEQIDIWSYIPDGDVTLYAKWTAAYLVNFDANGGYCDDGSTIQTWKVRTGDVICGEPGVFNDDETLAFAGWYLTADCSGEEIDPWEFCPETDLTLYAKWGLACTVIFDANGGYFDWEVRQEWADFRLAEGSSVFANGFALANDVPSLFDGWYYDAECTELACGREDEYIVEGDVRLYAKWIPAYVVTFDANGGYIWDEDLLQYVHLIREGSTVDYDPGAQNADEHLLLDGWYLSADGSGEQVDVYSYIPDGNVTFYAKWTRVNFVTFDANGGYFDWTDGQTLYMVPVQAGNAIDQTLMPSHEDETLGFGGWYLTQDCSGEAVDILNYYPTKDVVLYAKWCQPSLVTFNANGGYFAGDDPDETLVEKTKTVLFGECVGTPFYPTTIDDPHLVFSGEWYLDAACTGEPIDVYSYVPTGDVTFYAKWIEGVVVTCDANGGYFGTTENGASSVEFKMPKGTGFGGDTPWPQTNDESLMFSGKWYLNPECSGDPIGYGIVFDHDQTIYAKWEKACTITFDANGGQFNADETIQQVVVPESGVIENYFLHFYPYSADPTKVFDCWCYDREGTQLVGNACGACPGEDVTYYARWADACTLTIVSVHSDGENSEEFTVKKSGYLPAMSMLSLYLSSPLYLDRACTTPVFIDSYKVLEDTTLYRIVNEADMVSVTLDFNGGAWREPVTEELSSREELSVYRGNSLFANDLYGMAYWLYEDLYCKENSSFVGWTLTKNGTDFVDIHEPFFEDTVLYAKWTDAVTVTLEGGEYCFDYYERHPSTLSVSLPVGQPLAENLPVLMADNFFEGPVIDGWFFDEELTRPLTDDYILRTSVTLYPHWVTPYYININLNGQSYNKGINPFILVVPGEAVGRTYVPTSTQDDYIIFTGLSFDLEGNQMIEDLASYVPDGDMTIYCQWETGFNVKLDANGRLFSNGERIETLGVRNGEAIGDLPCLDEGLDEIVVGWYLDPTCTVSAGELSTLRPTDNVTYYAKWGDPLRITEQPEDFTVQAGSAYTLRVAATGVGLRYAWYYKAAGESSFSKSSVTTASYSNTARVNGNGMQLYCEVSDARGNVVNSDIATMTVTLPPLTITTQPQNISAQAGGSYTLNVAASGSGLSYVWYYKAAGDAGFTKSSVTSASYTNTARASGNGMQLYCEISDAYGQVVKSNTVKLTVTGTPLSITRQPQSLSVAAGKNYTLIVSASGTELSYVWYYKAAGDTGFTKSSVTSATYTNTARVSGNGMQLYCEVRDGFGNTVKSNTVTLTVTASNLQITTQPKNAAVNLNQTYTFSCVAKGDGVSYTWYYKFPGSTSFSKSSVTSSNYSNIGKLNGSGMQMYCVVSDKYGSTLKSDTATLFVYGAACQITEQPQNQVVDLGQRYSFTCGVAGEGLSYTWYYKFPGDAGFTKSSVTGATYSNVGKINGSGMQMYCVVKDSNGYSVTSRTATLFVRGAACQITDQPLNQVVELGQRYSFTCGVAGEGLSYTWYYKFPGDSGFTKSSVTGATYSNVGKINGSGMQMYCVVKDKNGYSATSRTATLFVKGAPCQITDQPADVTVAVGARYSFTCGVAGEGLSYAWYYKFPGDAGFTKSSASGATYSNTARAQTNGMQIYCVVTDKNGNTATSRTATLRLK